MLRRIPNQSNNASSSKRIPRSYKDIHKNIPREFYGRFRAEFQGILWRIERVPRMIPKKGMINVSRESSEEFKIIPRIFRKEF